MTKIIALIILFTLFCGNSYALPLRIILIRHAEKPKDKNSETLSKKGFQRAKALASIFEKQPELADKGLPFLFAAAYEPGVHSKRSILTLEPLAEKLHTPVESSYVAEDFKKLSQLLLTSQNFDKKVILIAWSHTEIVSLAKSLGATPPIKKWNKNTFDRMWVIDYQDQQTILRDLPQKLLPGDSH